ncbi:MAG: HAD-superfamily hydrolase [Chlamydiales bacterium]|jgi:HAD superfamily hydrolase (TIGR01509 family)|nr:HAD-superfamily hydrolase [Chlamydiales bacterium]
MEWLAPFNLIFFDFDGLLVDTEPLQFLAYQKALADRGCQLEWSFADYCQTAHRSATSFKEAVYQIFPHLQGSLDWKDLYAEKKGIYLSLLKTEPLSLMHGVEPLLEWVEKAGKRAVVVTHSSQECTWQVRRRLPALSSISHWVTREDYSQPKPFPDGYLKGMELYGHPKMKAIGFEDSPRGVRALLQTSIQPMLICKQHLLGLGYRDLLLQQAHPGRQVPHYQTFLDANF